MEIRKRCLLSGLLLLLSLMLFSSGATAQNTSTNALLNGTYAFLVSGYDSHNQAFSAVGSFVADGKGNITGGVEDYNSALTGPHLNLAITGSYTMVSNYRGTVTTASIFGGQFSWVIAVGAIIDGVATKGAVIRVQSGPNCTPATNSGFFEKQDPSAFSTAALSGAYVFGFKTKILKLTSDGKISGENYNGYIGSFAANAGNVTNGLADIVVGPGRPPTVYTAVPLTGTYSVDANGRGTATLAASTTPAIRLETVIYLVSADKWLVMGTQPDGAVMTGTVMRQTGAPFSTASCSGPVVWSTAMGYADAVFQWSDAVMAGVLTCDGSGHVSGVADVNNVGAIRSDGIVYWTLSMTSAANGRFVIQHSPYPIAGYMIGQNHFILLPLDYTVSLAEAEPQTGGPFTNASLNGAYFVGTEPLAGPVSQAAQAEVQTGVLIADGAATGWRVEETVSMAAPGFSVAGLALESGRAEQVTYNVAPDGRFTTDGYVGYIVSPTKVILADMKPGHRNPTIQVATQVAAPAQATPVSGWWWDPSHSGTGYFLEYGGASIGGLFMAGFVYDAAGNPTWLVSTGQMNGSTYSGVWLKATGGQSLLGEYRAPSTTAAGNVGITFSSPTAGVMTRPDGSQLHLQRFSFSTTPPAAPVDGAPEIGWWWGDPSALGYGTHFGSGTGYGIEFQGTAVFIVAYSYDGSGNPVWYLATGSLSSPNSYTGSWDLYAGGQKVSSATNISLAFSDASHGSLTMGNIVIPITRFQSF